MEQLDSSHWTDFNEIWHFEGFSKNLSRKSNFSPNLTRITGTLHNGYFTKLVLYKTGTLHEDIFTFMIISRWLLVIIGNISYKNVEKSKQTFCVQYLPSETRVVYEVMRKNMVERYRPRMTIWRMRIACWIPKATNTHLEYVTLIAFTLQHLSHESVSVLRYTYIACLVH